MWLPRQLLVSSCVRSSRRWFSSQDAASKVVRTCIVGSGPAGFYSAQYILKHLPNAKVDLIEKLPVPFGLVRFGVAPDHPEVKNVINTFTKTAENPNFRFFGNLSLGKDVSLNDLRSSYDVVLLTYGADIDSTLDIPGEDKKNVIPARHFVGWYNGLPQLENLNPDLSSENAVLLGQGNVAVDVARILLAPIDELRKTDITEHALKALSRSKVKNVYLVGRRGPIQAAYTIKELREMLKLPNVDTVWRGGDFIGVEEQIAKMERPRKRITELMVKSLKEAKSNADKKFLPVFFRSPVEINGGDCADSVTFRVTRLENDKAIATDEIETIEAGLVCRSIGYKSISVDPAINFDEKRGKVHNREGRVLQKNSSDPDPGLYVAGWLATGPSGVILTTMNNAFLVGRTIVSDVLANNIRTEASKAGIDSKQHRVVTWKDWQEIDRREVENGAKANKPREKILRVNEMMEVVGS